MNPFRNRWVRAAIIPFAIYFCTGWYYNSPLLYLHLVEEGAYSWKCAECNESYEGWDATKRICLNPEDPKKVVCLEQGDAVSKIFNLCSSMEFTGSFFAGLIFDLVGYRISMLVGYVMWNIGYYCVNFSTRSVQLYYLGAIMGGLAVNIAAFPALFIKDFFPGYENAAMIPNFCAQWSNSTIVKVLMMISSSSSITYNQAALGYGLLGIPFMTLFYFSLPKNREDLISQLREDGYPVPAETVKVSYKDILNTLKQWEVVVFACLVYTPLMISDNIYQVIVPAVTSTSVTNMIGNLQLLMPVFCLIFGLLGLFGSHPAIVWTPFMISFLGTLFGLISLLAPAGSDTFQKIGGGIFYLGYSYAAVTKYTFTSMIIDDAVFGTICGLTGTFEGLTQLLNMVWKSLSLNNPKGLVTGFCILIGIATCLLVLLIVRIYTGKLDHLKHIVTPENEKESGSAIANLETPALKGEGEEGDDAAEYSYYSASQEQEEKQH